MSGNVSQVIPTIQPMIGIAPLGTAIHTREFADAAVKPLARAGLLAAAKTMALTTFDLPRRSGPGAGGEGRIRAESLAMAGANPTLERREEQGRGGGGPARAASWRR
jgi:hypothetical protein